MYEELSPTMKQMKETCESISDTLEALVSGKLYDTETGELVDEKDVPEDHDEERYQGLHEYLFYDNLGVKVTSWLGGGYISCEICVGWGGPNIYINTGTHSVEGYWFGERYTSFITGDVCDAIDIEVEYILGDM